MGGEIRQLLRLWGAYARLDLTWFLRDTKYCIYNIIADTVSSLSAIAGVFLLAEQFGGIGGMDKLQILFMLGYATICDGIILMFFSMNNIAWISRLIGRGQLDHRLIQPVPLWKQFLTEGFIPVSGNSMLLCGIGITIYAASQLGLTISGPWLLQFVFLMLCSVAVILSCSFIAGSVAFYAPVAGEEISTTAISLFAALKSFPLDGLSTAARTVLCTVLPVGMAAWFPANLLLGLPPAGFPETLLIILTIIFTLTASTLFRKGMKHYAKNGSIRYADRGHHR
ncbi:MAG: hypothetical protein FH749_10360 [Firmicutes bacterium]|nr:hypothetical protein [Bacillota bacterium]